MSHKNLHFSIYKKEIQQYWATCLYDHNEFSWDGIEASLEGSALAHSPQSLPLLTLSHHTKHPSLIVVTCLAHKDFQ